MTAVAEGSPRWYFVLPNHTGDDHPPPEADQLIEVRSGADLPDLISTATLQHLIAERKVAGLKRTDRAPPPDRDAQLLVAARDAWLANAVAEVSRIALATWESAGPEEAIAGMLDKAATALRPGVMYPVRVSAPLIAELGELERDAYSAANRNLRERHFRAVYDHLRANSFYLPDTLSLSATAHVATALNSRLAFYLDRLKAGGHGERLAKELVYFLMEAERLREALTAVPRSPSDFDGLLNVATLAALAGPPHLGLLGAQALDTFSQAGVLELLKRHNVAPAGAHPPTLRLKPESGPGSTPRSRRYRPGYDDSWTLNAHQSSPGFGTK